jgi:hypothetical protein
MYERWRKKRRIDISSDNQADEDIRDRPKQRINSNIRSELRSVGEIKKVVAKREDQKFKNLPKDKRKSIERKQRMVKKGGAGGGGRDGGSKVGGGGGRSGGRRGGRGGGGKGGGQRR